MGVDQLFSGKCCEIVFNLLFQCLFVYLRVEVLFGYLFQSILIDIQDGGFMDKVIVFEEFFDLNVGDVQDVFWLQWVKNDGMVNMVDEFWLELLFYGLVVSVCLRLF